MGLPELLTRVNGEDFRSLVKARELKQQHDGETGVVLALRYPANGQFGLRPDRAWREVRVRVDDHIICSASVLGPGVRWVPLPPGRHQVRAESLVSSECLSVCDLTIPEGSAVIVSVLPRRRRGIVPGYRDGEVVTEPL